MPIEILMALLQAAQLVVIVVIGLYLKAFLPNYFNEKGKNLATKEDIAEITDKIEAVRAGYARQSHIQSLAFEKEFSILSEVWGKLVDLRNATLGLRPVYDHINPDEAEEERKTKRLERFVDSYNTLISVVEKNRPFYAKQIYKALLDIINVAVNEKEEYEIRDPERRPRDAKYWERAQNNQDKIVATIDKVSELIRDSLID